MTDLPLRQRIAELVASSALADPELLIQVIHQVDLGFQEAARRGDPGETDVAAVKRFVALCTEVTGPLVAAQRPEARVGIEKAATAATAYLAHPDEQTRAAYFAACTAVYPFGPGDGCHSLPELGGHGAPGCGCTTGVGFLAQVAYASSPSEVMALLRRDVLPRW